VTSRLNIEHYSYRLAHRKVINVEELPFTLGKYCKLDLIMNLDCATDGTGLEILLALESDDNFEVLSNVTHILNKILLLNSHFFLFVGDSYYYGAWLSRLKPLCITMVFLFPGEGSSRDRIRSIYFSNP